MNIISVENGTIGRIGGGNGDDVLAGADQADRLRGAQGNDLIDSSNNVVLWSAMTTARKACS